MGEERRKMRRNHQARISRWVRTIAGRLQLVGLVGRRNWEAKRKRRVQRGVDG